MILLEIDPVSQLWGITPATVFGALAAVLAFGCVMFWRKLAEKDKQITDNSTDYIKLLRENLGTLTDLKTSIDNMHSLLGDTKTSTLEGQTRISTQIDNTSERLSDHITHIKDRLPKP